MEHFARKTGRDVTDLVIVSDASKMGIHTMKRILEIIAELTLKFERIWILGNRFPENLKNILVEEVKNLNIDRVKLLGFISDNEEISFTFAVQYLIKNELSSIAVVLPIWLKKN